MTQTPPDDDKPMIKTGVVPDHWTVSDPHGLDRRCRACGRTFKGASGDPCPNLNCRDPQPED